MLYFSLMFLVMLMLSLSSLVANASCPPADAIEPCGCSEYDMGTIKLDCSNRKLNDSRVSYVLEVFLTTPGTSPVGFLDLWVNQLTRIPSQIKSFTQLRWLNFQYNPSITSIESGAFNFPDASNSIQMLFLKYNQISTIAPGAFKGSFAFILCIQFRPFFTQMD